MSRPVQIAIAVAVSVHVMPTVARAETVEERYATAIRAFEASDWYHRIVPYSRIATYAAKPFHWVWTEVPRSPWLLQYRVSIGFHSTHAPEFVRTILVVEKESGAVNPQLAPDIATALDRFQWAGPRCTFSSTRDGVVLVCPPTEQAPRPPIVRFRWDSRQRALAVAMEEEPAPVEVKHAHVLRAFRGSEPYSSFTLGRPVMWEAVVELPGGRWLLDFVRVETGAQTLFVVDRSSGRVALEETRALFARVEKASAECGEVALGKVLLGVTSTDGRQVALVGVGEGTGLPTCFLWIDSAFRVSSRFEWGRSTLPPEQEEAARERADRDQERRNAELAATLKKEHARAVSLLKRGRYEEATAALEALTDRCVQIMQSPCEPPREACIAAFNDLGYAFWLRKDLVRSAAYLFACASMVGGVYPVGRPVLMLNIADWYRDSGRPDQARVYLAELLASDAPKAQKAAAEEELKKLEGR